jgi:hypothetical protein
MKGARDQGLGEVVLIVCIRRRPTPTRDISRYTALAGSAMASKKTRPNQRAKGFGPVIRKGLSTGMNDFLCHRVARVGG